MATDLRKYVLAENIVEEPFVGTRAYMMTEFDFLCPNCGARHWARERMLYTRLRFVTYELPCGTVQMRMPWAETPRRDARSLYLGLDGSSELNEQTSQSLVSAAQ